MTLEDDIHAIKAWRSDVVGDTGELRAAAKMSTEAAEVLDIYIKAQDWPSRDVDELHVMREIGDTFVTLVGICQEADVDLEKCVHAAMEENTSEEWKASRGL
jgi:hypothetical protein